MLNIDEFRSAVVSFLRRLDPESDLVKRVYATYKWRQKGACCQGGFKYAVSWIIDRAVTGRSEIGATDWNFPMETVDPGFTAGLADAVRSVPDYRFEIALDYAKESDPSYRAAAEKRLDEAHPRPDGKKSSIVWGPSFRLDTQTDVALFMTKGLEGYWTNWGSGLGWDPW